MSSAPADQRTAVITGGTRGLGRALALAFAREGYRVYATGRREETLQALSGEARGALLGPRIELARYPLETFDQVMAANVRGPFDLTRQILPLLADDAAIEFVSSGVSEGPRVRWGAYNVSKIALDGLAGIWALELKERGVRVFLIDPGPMRTEMRATAYPDEDPGTLEPPEQRTGVFLWLARQADLSLSGRRFQAQEFTPRRPTRG
jgi:NAD(P)-dependent dehydrogenase (short-subunit alcohol dehydrogenase family)